MANSAPVVRYADMFAALGTEARLQILRLLLAMAGAGPSRIWTPGS